MASFSNDVKKEVIKSVTDKDKKYACLYGIILCCKSITDGKICFNTESSHLAKLFEELVHSVFGSEISIRTESMVKKNKNPLYFISIDDAVQTEQILRKYKIDRKDIKFDLYNIANNSLSAFLTGAFLISGSVGDPYKEYHLEFVLVSKEIAEEIKTMLLEIGVHGKLTLRKGLHVLYVKDSEGIEDVLTFIGATQSTIDLMNVKIFKDMRNKANRIKNCDTANISKAVSAATRQIDSIKTIEKHGKLSDLPPELLEICELRMEYPEISLTDLGQMLSRPIGRSGAARRFNRIAMIAKQLENEI